MKSTDLLVNPKITLALDAVSSAKLAQLKEELKKHQLLCDTLFKKLLASEAQLIAEGVITHTALEASFEDLPKTQGNSKINRLRSVFDGWLKAMDSRREVEFKIYEIENPNRGDSPLKKILERLLPSAEEIKREEAEQTKIETFLSELSPWGLWKRLPQAICAENLRREPSQSVGELPEKKRRKRARNPRREAIKQLIKPRLRESQYQFKALLVSLEASKVDGMESFHCDLVKNVCWIQLEGEEAPLSHKLDAMKALYTELKSEL